MKVFPPLILYKTSGLTKQTELDTKDKTIRLLLVILVPYHVKKSNIFQVTACLGILVINQPSLHYDNEGRK